MAAEYIPGEGRAAQAVAARRLSLRAYYLQFNAFD